MAALGILVAILPLTVLWSGPLPAQAEALHPVKQGDKWGYSDATGTIVIAPQFVHARPFSEGLAAVYVETSPPSQIGFMDSRGVRRTRPARGAWGFIREDGAMAIPAHFEGVGDFSEGLAAATHTDTWGYIDRQGKMVIRPQFSLAQPFSEGLARVQAGGIPLTDPFVLSYVSMGFIDKTGRWVIRSKFKYFFYSRFSNGLIAYLKNFGKWGYMDKTGKTVIRAQFDWAGPFRQDGLAPVVVKGRCAHVDTSGRIVGHLEPLAHPYRTVKRTFHFDPDPPPCS